MRKIDGWGEGNLGVIRGVFGSITVFEHRGAKLIAFSFSVDEASFFSTLLDRLTYLATPFLPLDQTSTYPS